MRINNPMLGMTDFSMIPSYFIDDASLLHGTSSVSETGGGLGGLVKLATTPAAADGFGLQYIQGIGMFRTFDEFLRLGWGDERWQVSTRAVCQSSANDYKYRNRDKKENIYDEEMNIVGSYYPTERNKSGAFDDVHVLQEVYYNTGRGDRFGLNAWYINSNRELPLLTTDYADDTQFENRQREHTLRSVLSWDHLRRDWKVAAKAGYIHTWMAYDYRRDKGNGILEVMTRSRSRINTLYGQAEGEYTVGEKWLFTANVSAHQHLVESADKNIIRQQGDKAVVGYDKGRIELDGSLSAKWRPTERLGMSVVLREAMYGTSWSPVIPAFFADCLLSRRGSVVAKASVSRNYRFPTLNDLYFLPGGNPGLNSEKGIAYEAGLSFAVGKGRLVHALGVGVVVRPAHRRLDSVAADGKGILLAGEHQKGPRLRRGDPGRPGRCAYQRAENQPRRHVLMGAVGQRGEPMSPADQSVGKQLPYEPEYSATATGRLSWRSWGLLYQFCYYSERYTMSSNDITLTGRLTPYLMSNLSLEKGFSFRWADLTLKGTVNNLFNEEYLSVLSRPMPRMNAEFFIGIKPKWRTKKR